MLELFVIVSSLLDTTAQKFWEMRPKELKEANSLAAFKTKICSELRFYR